MVEKFQHEQPRPLHFISKTCENMSRHDSSVISYIDSSSSVTGETDNRKENAFGDFLLVGFHLKET